MSAHLGEFVFSINGRDEGKCFVVISEQDNYLYLCDGKRRKVSNPKKKKLKHVGLTGKISGLAKERLSMSGELTNREVRRLLGDYKGVLSD